MFMFSISQFAVLSTNMSKNRCMANSYNHAIQYKNHTIIHSKFLGIRLDIHPVTQHVEEGGNLRR